MICNSYLLDSNAIIYKKKIINEKWVKHALNIIDNDGDIRYLNRIISILALEIWFKIFVTKELKKSSKL
jgi:asparagine synthase (glutamine-hydrolysing)